MRKAYHDTFISYKKDECLLINLGYDWCTEHEVGIKSIKDAFGIDVGGNKIGVDRRKITKLPKGLCFLDNVKEAILGTISPPIATAIFYTPGNSYRNDEIPRDLRWAHDYEIAAWDSHSFGIKAYTEENREVLRTLYKAFLKKDVVIYLGGNPNNPFANKGLIIGIASQIPDFLVKQMEELDKKE